MVKLKVMRNGYYDLWMALFLRWAVSTYAWLEESLRFFFLILLFSPLYLLSFAAQATRKSRLLQFLSSAIGA